MDSPAARTSPFLRDVPLRSQSEARAARRRDARRDAPETAPADPAIGRVTAALDRAAPPPPFVRAAETVGASESRLLLLEPGAFAVGQRRPTPDGFDVDMREHDHYEGRAGARGRRALLSTY
jgi:hypothetical protein